MTPSFEFMEEKRNASASNDLVLKRLQVDGATENVVLTHRVDWWLLEGGRDYIMHDGVCWMLVRCDHPECEMGKVTVTPVQSFIGSILNIRREPIPVRNIAFRGQVVFFEFEIRYTSSQVGDPS